MQVNDDTPLDRWDDGFEVKPGCCETTGELIVRGIGYAFWAAVVVVFTFALTYTKCPMGPAEG